MADKVSENSRGAFWLRHLVLPLALFLVSLAACEVSGIDLHLADRFFDFSRGEWPARDAWWADWLIRKRGEDLVIAIAAGSLLGWLGSFRFEGLRPLRWQLLYLGVAICLATGSVAALKKVTGRHCPWSMVRYGGGVPYTGLFEGNPPASGPGNCFPAGHAAGGFSLAAGYFAWRQSRPRRAKCWLGAGVLMGSIYGYGQMARGAHFFSHNIWSAIICWLVFLMLYLVMRKRLADRGPAAGTSE